ncbi:hypothetical protein FACS1894155_10050 [Bacteroidia bacterium]|nr:hypothetical protein FACS189455_3240 [Bacteroidia bacterium]GHU90984.1 hypothetical protein FACS1894155_10050 [Bacteroidia bacterium]
MKQVLFFIIFVLIHSGLAAHPKHEIRAVWLATNHALDWPDSPVRNQSDIVRQQQSLCQILDELKEANFNVVFLQTRIRGNVIYPSKIEPWSNFVNWDPSLNPGYDPLDFAIKACHERGLACHAWFVTFPLGLEKINGRPNNSPTIIKNKDLVKKFRGELYLDPGNPQTRVYLLSLVKEIVSCYDIDGFHFDYIRYPDRASDFPDRDSYNRYGQKQNIESWRRDNINQLVYAAYDTIKSLKPWVIVSSSVLGMYQKIPGNTQAHWTAYSSVFQDPVNWLSKGKHDWIVPMMYYSDNLFFPFVENWQEHSYGRYVVPGIGLYRMDQNEGGWDVSTILDQIRYSRLSRTRGNAFYRTWYLMDNTKGISDSIKTGFYRYPSQLPPIYWQDSIAPVVPCKPDAVQSGDSLHITWNYPEVSEKLYFNVYCSGNFPVDIENPENLLATRVSGTGFSIPVDRNREKGYYYLVTAGDRYHNESEPSKVVFFYMGSLEK